MNAVPSKGDEFSSRALLQRSRDAIFVLNRQQRLRFANSAWERLTGQSLEDAYGLICSRRAKRPLARALSPPPEALTGAVAHARRPAPPARVGPPWWDLVFLPLTGADGLVGVIGRITVIGQAVAGKSSALPEGVLQLRMQLKERFRFDLLTSHVPALERAAEQARLASQNRAPLVLIGPAGSGKRWLARTVHHHGLTAEQGFLGVDSLALPPAALEALLFGGVGLGRPDQLGTVYLRSPEHLPRDLQVRLAAWLGDHPADGPRIVAGFRHDPAAAVAAGRLAPELHLSLSIQTIALPPLRERRDDLPWLATVMLDRAAAAGVPKAPGLKPEALEVMAEYSWPGNLRELDAALAFAARQANGQLIGAEHLPNSILREATRQQAVASSPTVPVAPLTPLDPLLARVERRLILAALRNARGVKTEAARLLEIPYARLIRRMQALAITGTEDR